MKHLLLAVFFWGCWAGAEGQKHDYQWLFGYDNRDVGVDSFRGGVNLDFNYSPAQIYRHIRLAGFNECNTSFCDNNGNLMMYSNGADVFDTRDSVMLGGDSLNYGVYWHSSFLNPINRYDGLRICQSLLSLPDPSDSTKIYIVHFNIRLDQPGGGVPAYLTDTSYYTLIDRNGNFGFGSVVKKNIKIDHDTLAFANLSATRHGNGKDWWILHPYFEGNCYYEFLLNDTGIGLYNIQCIGADQLYYGALGTSCFSPDGEKYFWVNQGDGIRMFDFDRCTGLLSNPQIIPFPYPSFIDSINIAAGIAVSPNNRFLYVTTNRIVLQYDLEAPDIGASVDTVAVWDGVYDPFPPLAATFYLAQLAPDGKIYINSTNGIISLHVINRPDEKGDSCLFVQRGVRLGTYNANSLPNFPNYRLGSKAGSACDTLSGLSETARSEKEKIIKVFPNPASDILTVDYGFTDWNKGDVSLEIVNELGQVVMQQHLPMYSGFQKIDVSQFASGLYTTYIKRSNQIVATAKFAKE